ncbi:hypothetical protein [Acinetobacter proteolyticus]|uniref:hypothetical protein n=1 Tax=Acinetobacter proteolyticus TaxID=1776741 RepID=UPI003D997F70
MKKIILTSLLCLAFTGCATSSGLDAKVSTSGFDNSKSVAIIPHGAACTTMYCPAIGASWIDKDKENVGLTFQVSNITSAIYSASLNIDGEIINFKNQHLTDFNSSSGMQSSRMMEVTDYKVIEKILNSKRTWVKISTSKGAFEAAIVEDGKDSKAFHALKRFNEQVALVNK